MNWETQARKRIANDVQLSRHEAHIFYDWCNWDEHMEWVASADRQEIVDWCDATSIEESS